MGTMHTLDQLVLKMVGSIYPQGCSSLDEERLNNLNELGDILNYLLREVSVVSSCRHSQEASVKALGEKAHKILLEAREWSE